ncbi:MAG: hypothetical protein ACXVCY_02670 [Pseudobdellovibrionaceae bacterium]
MKLLVSLSVLLFILPHAVNAAALCPSDSCNPANGCLDGCTADQLRCSTQSESQCRGQIIDTPCVWKIQGISGHGFCSPNSTHLPSSCSCQ